MKWQSVTGGVVLIAAAMAGLGQSSGPSGEAEASAESPEVQAEQLLPLAERTHTFRIIEGQRAGELVPLSLRPARADELGEWVLDLSDLNTLHLRRSSAGDVEVVRLVLPRENRAVEYSPAVQLIPARLQPQVRGESTGLARIYNLNTGELVRTGQFTHAVEQISRSRFDTAVGDRVGYLVVLDHRINLDLGQLQLNLEGGYVPGEGMVYRHTRYTIEKLGLFGDTTRRTAVLAED